MEKYSPRQRVLTALSHHEPDRPPIRFNSRPGSDGESGYERLECYLNIKDDEALRRRLGEDVRRVEPGHRPGFHEEVRQNPKYAGIVGSGARLAHLRDVGELDLLEDYMRDSLGFFDLSDFAERIDQYRNEYFVYITSPTHLFTAGRVFRGDERFLMDFYLNPDFIERFCEIRMDFIIAWLREVLQAGGGKIDMVYYGDDLGTQEDLMISPETCRRFFFPRYRKIFDLIHSFGAKVFMHCCGAITKIIPDLIDIGVDVLNPVQVTARRMDPVFLKKEYGKSLTFCGAIDLQRLLPFGTVEQVRAEVRRMIDVLGRDGGYIVDTTNIVHPDCKEENLVAMFDTARNYSCGEQRVPCRAKRPTPRSAAGDVGCV